MNINIIYGPPGTGKTTELLNILEKLLVDYLPSEIAFVSFTKEGAYQGKYRAKEKFSEFRDKDFLHFSTLHSMAFKQLKLNKNDVIQRKHYKIFSEKIGMNFVGYYTEDFINNDDKYLFFHDVCRNNFNCAKNYIDSLDTQKIKYVSSNYEKFKKSYHLIDYTDMIDIFCEKDLSVPVKIAIIDEAQDLTTLQWKMVWTAFKNCDEVYIAGDDDQAIYQWSGADVDYFTKLKGNIKILKKSHRLPNKILDFSKSILSQIENRVPKNYESTDRKGSVQLIRELEELDLMNGETWKILSRNHYHLRNIEEYFQDYGILYKYKKTPSMLEKEYKLIKLYENVRKTNIMTKEQEYLLKPVLKEDINLKKTWYDNFNWEHKKIHYYRNVIGNKNLNFSDIKIDIGTIHSSKGAEYDNIVILSDITKNVKDNLEKNQDSEHRVFYVGCTRAKKNLYIKESRTRYEYKFYGEV